METVEILAIIVFAITFIAIAIHKTPWFELKRSYVALIGGILMLIIGAISFNDALNSINFGVIFLLIGMMALVAGLEYVGFFTVMSDFIVKHSDSKIKMLAVIMVISAVLSMIAMNDAVVLMFTPIVIRCCVKQNTNPIPYLIGMVMAANIGSVATAIGNPQNAFIVSTFGMDFVTFFLYCFPIAVLCLIAASLVLWTYYKKKMGTSYGYDRSVSVEERSVDKNRYRAMVVLLIITFAFFIITGYTDIELWHVALVSGAVSLIIVMTSSVKDAKWVALRIDWHIIIFFIGLFVLIGGATQTGIISDLADLFPGFGPGETPSVSLLSLFSVILSNIFSNVPAVMVISQMLPLDNTLMWITLAASSTLAGNTTLMGSAANIIMAERSEKYGITINYFRFLAIGVLVTIVTIAIMIGMLHLLF